MRRLFLALLLAGACGHIPKADPAGVPPPWPETRAPVKPVPSEQPPPAPPQQEPEKPSKKPVVPPLKRDLLPPPPQT